MVLVRAARWLSEWASALLNLAGGILLAVWQMPGDEARLGRFDAHVVLIVSGAACLVLGLGMQTHRSTTKSAVRAQLEEARDEVRRLEDRSDALSGVLRLLLEAQLRILAQAVFGNCHDQRITLFTHAGEGRFVAVARWSDNPTFAAPGRGVYPDGQGVLGTAWAKGHAVVPQMPDPQANPDQWLRAQKDRCDIPRKIAQSLTMRSREYAAYRLDSRHGRPMGVIVFETAGARALPIQLIGNYIRNTEGARLSHFLEMMASIQPELSFAKERGF